MTSWRKKLARWRRSLSGPTAPDTRKLIRESGLFDPAWYLERYPDVADAGFDALDHYVGHGGAEGRKAGPFFDSRWYADRYPDVRPSGLHPMVHFLLHGEGRETIKRVGLKGFKTGPRDFEEANEILASPLFDALWYSDLNALNASPQTSALHYLKVGGLTGVPASPRFDSETYLRVYSDVRDTGANPLLHYIRYGEAEDRRVFSVSVEAAQNSTTVEARAASTAAASRSFGSGRPLARLLQPQPRTDEDWTPSAKLAAGPGMALVRFGSVNVGLLPEVFEAATAPLPHDLARAVGLFCELGGVALPDFVSARNGRRPRQVPDAPAASGTSGPEILDAWFLNDDVVRLRFPARAGASGAVRILQLDPRSGACLVGEGEIRRDWPSIVDARLTNPFQPILVVHTDASGQLQAGGIVPFPSLFRGGAHQAEAAIFADGADAMERQSRLSAMLLRDATGWEGAPPMRLGSVRIDLRGATGAERVFSGAALDWMTALGVSLSGVNPDPAAPAPVGDHLIAALDRPALGARARADDVVTLPCDALPTLSTLFRRTPFPGEIGDYLVVDRLSCKPRWLVTLPERTARLEALQHENAPLAFPSISVRSGGGAIQSLRAGPLAVRYRSPVDHNDPVLTFPIATDANAPLLGAGPVRGRRGKGTICVLVQITAAAEAASMLESLARQTIAARLYVVASSPPDVVVDALLSRLFPNRHQRHTPTSASTAANFNVAAALAPASAEMLLLMRQGVVLHDVRTLEVLARIASQPHAASASCVQIRPAGFQAGAALQFHTGGLFPNAISFAQGPSATFTTPDIQGALPLSTYPVAGNDMGVFMLPVSAWKALGGFDAERYPLEGHDLDFNLRAVKSGLTHFCTSIVTATAPGDPGTQAVRQVSTGTLSFDDLAALLKRVTILRALG
jgi:hypothetical protein